MAKSKLYGMTKDETFYTKDEIKHRLNDDYIRGLIEGEGCFGTHRNYYGEEVPAFVLAMHARDKEMLEAIVDYLDLPDRVYDYRHNGRHYVKFQVRDIGDLKNIIIPLFKNKLLGHKGTQLAAWLKKYPYLEGLHQK